MENDFKFSGPFKDILPQYIEYKQSQGFSFSGSTYRALKAMDNFFAKNYNISDIILTKEMVLNFIKYKKNEASSTTCLRCTYIRGFAKYLKVLGYTDIYILESQYIPKHTTSFIPFIFSNEQIHTIFEMIDNYQFQSLYLRKNRIYATLIRILYGCGLRLGEAVSLKVSDVDITNSIIQVLHSKNNKSRIVCMSESLNIIVKNYILDSDLASNDWLFPSPKGGHYSTDAVYDFFKGLLKKAGIYNAYGKLPRVHDLRHTFSVHSLRKMVESGMDIYCTLPFLSSFLGHENIYCTEKYLQLIEQDFSKVVNIDIFGGNSDE